MLRNGEDGRNYFQQVLQFHGWGRGGGGGGGKLFQRETFLLDLRNDIIYLFAFSSRRKGDEKNGRKDGMAHATSTSSTKTLLSFVVLPLHSPHLNDFDDNFLSCWLELRSWDEFKSQLKASSELPCLMPEWLLLLSLSLFICMLQISFLTDDYHRLNEGKCHLALSLQRADDDATCWLYERY
jgi:hypothetical protein